MELELRQEQQLSMRQLHSLRLLQMGRLEMREYLETVAQENPTVELELPHEEEPLTRQAERWLDRWRWLEENDRQNSYYERPNQEEEDSPMNRIGTDGGLAETLESFLCRQIAGLEVPERQRQLLYYLVGCLEDSGYLTTPPEELAVGAGVPEEELRRSIARLQTLEPAGVGAADLSQCLYLQLQRIGDDGPATQIVLHHLETLAKNRYHQIAQALHISQEEVRRAQQRIRQLDPRPGRQFSPPEPAPMVYPDVFVVEQEGEFVCDDHRRPAPMLHLNRYYQDLYRQTDDPEVKKYLAEKLVQAENVLFALRQRESTMLRCARFVAAGQQAFFRDGPRALRPMYMTEAAQALDVHLSTVSRAVKDKYLQCRQGVFPLSYFFSAPAPDGSDVSRRAVLLQLRELIDGEDKAHPLSDEKLRCLLEQKGCVLSRRTVAKYREELGIPGTAGRRE